MKNRSAIYRKRIMDTLAHCDSGVVYLYAEAVHVAFTQEEWEELLAAHGHVRVCLLSEEELLAMDATTEQGGETV